MIIKDCCDVYCYRELVLICIILRVYFGNVKILFWN